MTCVVLFVLRLPNNCAAANGRGGGRWRSAFSVLPQVQRLQARSRSSLLHLPAMHRQGATSRHCLYFVVHATKSSVFASLCAEGASGRCNVERVLSMVSDESLIRRCIQSPLNGPPVTCSIWTALVAWSFPYSRHVVQTASAVLKRLGVLMIFSVKQGRFLV